MLARNFVDMWVDHFRIMTFIHQCSKIKSWKLNCLRPPQCYWRCEKSCACISGACFWGMRPPALLYVTAAPTSAAGQHLKLEHEWDGWLEIRCGFVFCFPTCCSFFLLCWKTKSIQDGENDWTGPESPTVRWWALPIHPSDSIDSPK